MKAAMEQAQSMFGNTPGFQMPEGIQEQITTQMTAGIPNMAEVQAQQEAILKAAKIDMGTVAEAGRQNMAFAQQMMQDFYDADGLDTGWTILREWWNVTNRESTLDIIKWLLEEGHHVEADRVLVKKRECGLENISAVELRRITIRTIKSMITI